MGMGCIERGCCRERRHCTVDHCQLLFNLFQLSPIHCSVRTTAHHKDHLSPSLRGELPLSGCGRSQGSHSSAQRSPHARATNPLCGRSLCIAPPVSANLGASGRRAVGSSSLSGDSSLSPPPGAHSHTHLARFRHRISLHTFSEL